MSGREIQFIHYITNSQIMENENGFVTWSIKSKIQKGVATVENGTSATAKWPNWVSYSNYTGTDLLSEA